MAFLSIASIIICPMWLATCPCEADSVVGKIKTMVGKTVRAVASNTGTSKWIICKRALVISD